MDKMTLDIEFNEKTQSWELDLGDYPFVIKSKNDVHILTSGYTNIKSKRHFMNMFPEIGYEQAGDRKFIDMCNKFLHDKYTYNPENYSFELKGEMKVEPFCDHSKDDKKDS